ncbi:hypothetical protein SMACR_09394, partial [Sordaria macrospora]
MTDRAQALVLDQQQIIQDHPIGTGLDAFRASFESVCKDRGISCPAPDALSQLGPQGRGTLQIDLLKRIPALISDDLYNFDSDQFEPLLNAVLANKPDDEIWRQVYCAVTEATPPPRPIASYLLQTPRSINTSSFANSSELRKHVDVVLKDELGSIYIGLPNLHYIFFSQVAGLKT